MGRWHGPWTMYFPIEDWLAAFLLTLAIEAPIVLALLRRTQPDLVRLGILVFFVNLGTHLSVWYVFTQVLLIGTPQYTLGVEAWAVAAEAVFYWAAVRGLTAGRAVAVAVVANVASFVVGRLVGGLLPELL